MPHLAAALPDLLRTARRHGATTSVDTNDDPTGRWEPAGLAAVLAHTDFLLPNAAEARHLAAPTGIAGPADVTDPAEAAARLAALGPVTVVKNGADGALCHDGERLLTTRGIHVEPVDAVGAGDSFDAGFIAGLLNGMPLSDALRLAAVCGALSTRAPPAAPPPSPPGTKHSPALPRPRKPRMTTPKIVFVGVSAHRLHPVCSRISSPSTN